jgi:hypothetical protein
MKVYVDELPKSCEECLMCRSGKLKLQRKGRYVEAEQCVFGQYKYQTIDDEINTCPLQSLADYTKQVRKEAVQELKEKLKSKEEFHPEDEFTIDYDFYYKEDVEDVLNEIQGE